MSKITISLTATLLGLDGSPWAGKDGQQPPTSIGKALASVMYVSDAPDPLKAHVWATSFYADQPIELDLSDVEALKKLVKDLPISMGPKATILKSIIDQQNEQSAKKP